MIFGKNKSLACFKPNPAAALRLICFPCAGGGASMYRRWAEISSDVEVWAVNYPGRESLHDQPFADSTDALVELILENLDVFKAKPMVLYGHSFGAFVAFDCAYKLQQLGVTPKGLVVSARRAPQLAAQFLITDMPEKSFVDELDRLGGLPDAIRNSQEMMDFYLPIIKADLYLNDHCLVPATAKVDCPICLYSATKDKVADRTELEAWRDVTTAHFQHKTFEGGHFFIQDQVELFLASLKPVLLSYGQESDEDLIAF
ncbi:thioesterase [Ketobacter sp. MCCC 1A13808]|uniref:thioesterase II family protein n=1 Tax=Ketobacter sp. MCCC 1A13808 TaxID=2602738 RepID=UPI0012EBDED9|nr:alpha/beta fold hydrolase [Ketobacter sp. MCCC 1A13808]MVF11052.1 thioesterase [Ketobacter sp. MCCC 1A13808]